MATWDEIGFRERVLSAARDRGMDTLSEVARHAHIDPKYFRDDRPHLPDGRNVRHVLLIAEALGVDPAWLMGLESARQPADASDALEKVAFVSSLAAHLYVALAARRPPPLADMKKLVRMLVDLIDYTDTAAPPAKDDSAQR